MTFALIHHPLTPANLERELRRLPPSDPCATEIRRLLARELAAQTYPVPEVPECRSATCCGE